MRINMLRHTNPVEVTFDDVVVTPTGEVSFHPDLTTHLSGKQWTDLYDAMAFALRQGIVMNVHITIVWGRLGVHGDNVAREFLEDFCEVLKKRAKARRLPCGYIYAHENTRDEGLHTHLLTLWPHLDGANFELWVDKYFMKRSRLRVADLTAVKVSHRRDNDVARHWFWFGYVTKGTHTGAAIAVRRPERVVAWLSDLMLRRPEPGGGVVRCRKRVGVSRNLDRKARRDFGPDGFWSLLDRGVVFRKEDLYTDTHLQAHERDKQMDPSRFGIRSLAL
jgi:hypothetical protein